MWREGHCTRGVARRVKAVQTVLPMVRSEHLQQAALADDDDSVVAALESLPVERNPGDELLVLGLRNAEGVVYRRFEVQGMRMALRISNLLREFGYAAEQGGSGAQASGCRIVFTRTARMPRERING